MKKEKSPEPWSGIFAAKTIRRIRSPRLLRSLGMFQGRESRIDRTLGLLRLVLLVGAGMTLGFFLVSVAFAADALPAPTKIGLPLEDMNPSTNNPAPQVVAIIKEAIKYVGVLAIMSISWGGIQFLVSIGDDGKVKKAKSIIQYSLLGVVLSIAAYTIIDIVNSLSLVSR